MPSSAGDSASAQESHEPSSYGRRSAVRIERVGSMASRSWISASPEQREPLSASARSRDRRKAGIRQAEPHHHQAGAD